MAHFVRTHGVDGGLILKFQNSSPEDFMELELVFVEFDDILVPFFVQSFRVRNTETAIVELQDVSSEDLAKELLRRPVYVDKSTMDEADEVPWLRLVGLQLADEQHGELGPITGILEIPNNAQFEVAYQGRELLVPINDDFIVELDMDAKRILMRLPDGLLDLND